MQPEKSDPLADVSFSTELLAALGLAGTRRVISLRLDVENLLPSFTMTQLITREQGAAVIALLRRKRFVVSEPIDLGDRPIEASAADADFRLTPKFHRPAD
ncbi:MAG: hypothetical protein RL375_2970 [Pseudomonadota bacterium]|jgi:hypothetical protein